MQIDEDPLISITLVDFTPNDEKFPLSETFQLENLIHNFRKKIREPRRRYSNKQVQNFADLPIHVDLLKGIYDHGLENMSETQKKCILPIISSEPPIDTVIIGNGSDNIISYCISVIQRLDLNQELKPMSPQALVIVPSRELAYRTLQIFESIGKYSNLKVKPLVISPNNSDDNSDDNCHVIIGTPGITASYIKNGLLSVKNLKILVLDEVEDLISLFVLYRKIYEILKSAKKLNLQICFCCQRAISKDVQELIDKQLVDPVIFANDDNLN